jgi:hypothetical protein
VPGPPPHRDFLVCPSVTRLTLAELASLRQCVAAGATLYLSLGDHLHGFPGTELTGAEIEDFCGPSGKEYLLWDTDRWPLDWTGSDTRPTLLRLAGAECLASYPDGTPALTAHRYGEGTVLFCNAPVEAMLDRQGTPARSGLHRLYLRLAELAGVAPAVSCSSPDVEVIDGVGLQGDGLLLVNHAAEPVTVRVAPRAGGGRHQTVELAGKDWAVVRDHQG